jgi:hypothetical protein
MEKYLMMINMLPYPGGALGKRLILGNYFGVITVFWTHPSVAFQFSQGLYPFCAAYWMADYP